MKKNRIIGGNIKIVEEGKKKSKYTIAYVIFDPKTRVVSADEAKKMEARRRKIGFAKMKEDFDAIYVKAYKDKMGRRNVTMYKVCKKAEANCIFVVPTKWKKEAKKVICEYFNFAL